MDEGKPNAKICFFLCESCHIRLKAPLRLSGRALDCPHCGTRVTVPVVTTTDSRKIAAEPTLTDSFQTIDRGSRRISPDQNEDLDPFADAAEGREPAIAGKREDDDWRVVPGEPSQVCETKPSDMVSSEDDSLDDHGWLDDVVPEKVHKTAPVIRKARTRPKHVPRREVNDERPKPLPLAKLVEKISRPTVGATRSPLKGERAYYVCVMIALIPLGIWMIGLLAWPEASSDPADLMAEPQARNPIEILSIAAVTLAAYLWWLRLIPSDKTVSTLRLAATLTVSGVQAWLIVMGVQLAGSLSKHAIVVFGPALVILVILRLIAFSYSLAADPESSYVASALGFAFGVGLVEEFAKSATVSNYLRATNGTSRGACLIGLASGIGFGLAESLHYGLTVYDSSTPMYVIVVRFASLTMFHGILTSCVALMMYANQDYLSDWHVSAWIMYIFCYLSVAIVLHGFYDTMLKKEQPLLALLVAAATCGWWLWLMRRQRLADVRLPIDRGI